MRFPRILRRACFAAAVLACAGGGNASANDNADVAFTVWIREQVEAAARIFEERMPVGLFPAGYRIRERHLARLAGRSWLGNPSPSAFPVSVHFHDPRSLRPGVDDEDLRVEIWDGRGTRITEDIAGSALTVNRRQWDERRVLRVRIIRNGFIDDTVLGSFSIDLRRGMVRVNLTQALSGLYQGLSEEVLERLHQESISDRDLRAHYSDFVRVFRNRFERMIGGWYPIATEDYKDGTPRWSGVPRFVDFLRTGSINGVIHRNRRFRNRHVELEFSRHFSMVIGPPDEAFDPVIGREPRRR